MLAVTLVRYAVQDCLIYVSLRYYINQLTLKSTTFRN